MDRKKTALVYVMSRKSIIAVTVYYTVIILSSIIGLVYVMSISNKIPADEILFYSGISAIAVSSMLCCIQYIKRLYKACIDMRISEPRVPADLRQLGNIIYFVLRPVYAIAFSVVVIFALLAGVIIVTTIDLELNSRFLYLCVVISSMIGFSIGRMLDAFESISDRKIRKITADVEGGSKDDKN